jgi:CDGSH-type Zn-finger protein
VFKKDTHPWIDADGAAGEEITSVVSMCPSGALHAKLKDGTSAEEPPKRNRLLLWKDGPLQFMGRLEIQGTNIDIRSETRATLCRCGESHNKPFCDNSHREVAFNALDSDNIVFESEDIATGIVTINPESNGPYHVTGNFEILNAAGEVIFAGDDVWLCRCGHSNNKPFCDSTHEVIGFQAE